MSTWQHILIAALIPSIILLGGSILFFIIGQPLFAILIPIPAAVSALFAFMKQVSAKCPDCGGKAFLKRSNEKKFYYECLNCGVLEKPECSLDE
jgi:predicted RNA-binding Zn-ribbon protein involved in translation (DUF1610 family)